MKLFPLLLLIFLSSNHAYCANYFWVGNSGNWSDLAHWSNSTGGAGGSYGSLPSTSDNVFFNANSFSAGGQTVTLDVSGSTANFDFTGVTNNPTLSGAVSESINVAGNLIFTAGFTHSFLGTYTFSSTTAQNITSAGQTFNSSIRFNGVGGTWNLIDAIVVTGAIELQNGIFNSSNFNITVGSIDANQGTNIRTINFGSSAVTIVDAGTSLDLRGNTTNLTVSSLVGCLVTFTNSADITAEFGDETKTIPSLNFLNCSGNIQLATGPTESTTKRITFGNITASVNGVDIRMDGNNDDSNIKTYGTITLPNNCRYVFGSGDGTGGFGGVNHTIVTGDFIVGNDGEGDVNGRYIEFLGDYDAGNGTDCRFKRRTQFKADFNIDGTAMDGIILDQDTEFSQDININGTSTFRLDEDINIAGNINLANNADLNFNNNGSTAITTVTGVLTTGLESIVDLGGGTQGPITFGGITLGSKSQLDFNNNSSLTTVGNLTLSSFNIVSFNTNGTTTITGSLTAIGSCDQWLWLKSLVDGNQATVTLSSAQAINLNICQDINCTTSNLTNTGGVDLSNNLGITFPAPIVGTTFFWVGSTTGNTKTGTFTTGINSDWSNPDNWSLVSGTYSGTNSCIPGAHDNVVFNANSFSSGIGTVDLDLFIQACNSMTWTGIPAGCTIDASSTTTSRELIIFGNVSLHSNLDNQFEGLTTFSAHDATVRTLTSNSSNFFGNIDFDFIGGNWILADDFTMTGDERADVTFRNGTVDGSNRTWNIEDDWTILNGVFTANTSTVNFNGQSSQTSRQQVTSNNNNFYDFTVNRQQNGGGQERTVRILDPLTINNDLSISKGSLEDFGSQITGAAAGNMTIANQARIVLGKNNVSTVFPTNYLTANINLNERGHTRYNSSIAQTISSVPDYGRLYLTNVNHGLKDKTLDGTIFINDLLFIDDFNHLIDNGFQITGDVGERFQMEPDSKMTLGTAASSTFFPLTFDDIRIMHESEIVYNSGLDQPIKGLSGAGNEQYSHLTLTNPGAGTPEKILLGDLIIRGDLTINVNDEMDIDAATTFNIELLGNWINLGTFDEHQGRVSFVGTATQTLTSGGTTEGFYGYVINNTSAGGVVIDDDIEIAQAMIFTDGIVYEGSGGNELITFLSGATIIGTPTDASHADGRVEKIGAIAFDFPVGKNGRYRPISIGIPTLANTGFRAEYFESDPHPTYDHNALVATLNHISSCEYWILDRIAITAAGNTDVTLSWSSSTSCGVTHLTDLKVARWDGAIWQDEGNGGTSGSTTSGTIISSANVTSFSPFTLGSINTNNPLPIKLVEFEANLIQNKIVDLTWATASETNNDYFTIERSIDGISFEKVEIIQGAGNSSDIIQYTTIDRQPYAGVSYYRLKQTDFNGDVTYSQLKSITIVVNDFVIYPNPINKPSLLFIDVPSEIEIFSISITNLLGQTLFFSEFNQNNLKISTDSLSKGTYLLTLKSGTITQVKKIIIR